jgi:ATP-binding cassette subfamily G (WHITE) protein 2 (PDR)
MTLIFNGVMQTPDALPGFWIFMYRVSPLTYWVAGIAAAMLHGRQVVCAEAELSIFNPPAGETCGQYMQAYLTQAPGTLNNPDASADCSYCALSVADQYLNGSNIYWSERWRNFGLMWAYVIFNIAAATFLYYFFRVRKSSGKSSDKVQKLGFGLKWIVNKFWKKQH